jgi:hypothetical protein
MELLWTADGRRLFVSRTVEAPAEVVWELLVDTRRWPEWGPSVTDVECSDRVIREGSTGRVRVAGAIWVPFEIVSCTGLRWTWRVAKIPATGHRVEPYNGTCRVGFELPLWGVGYVPVCERALDRIAEMVE